MRTTNQSSQADLTGANGSASIPSRTVAHDLIGIPGLHDGAVEEYSDWQQSRVRRGILKDDIRNARDLALENGLISSRFAVTKTQSSSLSKASKWRLRIDSFVRLPNKWNSLNRTV